MQFRDTTNSQGLVEDTLFLANTVTASYAIADITRNLNEAVLRAQTIIWDATDGWGWEDSGRTDYPRVLGTLVHGQQDYRVAAISAVARHVHRVEVKDENGDWHVIKPRKLSDVPVAKEEWFETANRPLFYDLQGGFLSLFPKPSSAYTTLASGVALYVSRDAMLFSATDTTASPGFAPQFHRYLSISAAMDFVQDRDELKRLAYMRDRIEKAMKHYYGSRAAEFKPQIKPRAKRRWRQYL